MNIIVQKRAGDFIAQFEGTSLWDCGATFDAAVGALIRSGGKSALGVEIKVIPFGDPRPCELGLQGVGDGTAEPA